MLRLIQVPYDSGGRDRRMGRGPSHLVERGALERLKDITGSVEPVVVEYQDNFPIEIATTFGLLRAIAQQVQMASSRGEFPLTLAGNCHSTVGALGGIESTRYGLVWFDAHGDFNTPETTTTGFMDGMPVSMAVGHCWKALTSSIHGFRPLPENRVMLVGACDLDNAESERLEASEVHVVPSATIQQQGVEEALTRVLSRWSEELEDVYVHVDMDVHHPDLVPVNSYQPPEGLTPEEVQGCIRTIAGQFRLVGASVTAYDPDCDVDDKGLNAGLSLIELLAQLSHEQSRLSNNGARSR